MDLVHLLGAFAGQLIIAGAIYGGIRADLRNLSQRVARHDEVIDRVHERIDNLVQKGNHQ